MKELRNPTSNWREIAEHEAARIELQAEVELARLVEERQSLETQHTRVEESLTQVATPVPTLRVHEMSRRWWCFLFVFTVGVAGASAWWSISWYATLTWEKVLIPTTIVVLPLIGWIALLRQLDISEASLRRMVAGLGFAIILGSMVAGASLAIGRTIGVTFVEGRESAPSPGGELDGPAEPSSTVVKAERLKRILAITLMIAVLFFGVAGEVAAGIAFDEFKRHSTVVRTVKPLYEERDALEKRLVENAHLQEAARRRARLVLVTRTIDGLQKEEAASREAAEATERRDEEERRRQSFGPLVWKIAIAFALTCLAAIVFAAWALAAERELSGSTVVLVDLSVSTVTDEFEKNLRAVEGIIRRAGEGGRLTVLGITDASFGAEPLLRAAAPASKGRFGEHLEAWRDTVIHDWRKTTASLGPTARGTDVFGALARAAVECDGAGGECRVLVLSDMRHVGRGINLERSGGISARLIADVERQGLVARLHGASVWALGVHTVGLDERQWQELRAFWTEYFRLAGAHLVAFSPNRRLAEGG